MWVLVIGNKILTGDCSSVFWFLLLKNRNDYSVSRIQLKNIQTTDVFHQGGWYLLEMTETVS